MSVAADLAEAVLDVPVDVEVEVEVEVDVDVVVVAVELVVLATLERSGSVVNTAVRPVTLVQSWFGVPVPGTKLTAAHWNRSRLRVLSSHC
jgi:hypothetical protein